MKYGGIHLQSRRLGLPALFHGNQLGRPLTNGQHRKHRVDGGHLREHAGVGNAQLLDPSDLELVIHDGCLVLGHIAHLGGTGRVVDSVGGTASVFANLFVGLHLGAGGHFFLQPLLERALLGNFTGSLDSSDKGGGVVAFGVGKVPEIQSRLHCRIGGSQIDAAARSRPGNVGGHAECIAIANLWVAQPLGVECEGNLVAVHHDVGGISVLASSVGGFSADKDTGIRVHGGLVGGNWRVKLPHDDGLWVVKQVLANTGDILDDRKSQTLELRARPKTRVKHQARRVDSTGAKDNFLAGLQHRFLARRQVQNDTTGNIILHQDLGDVSLGQDSQVWPPLLATQDGVDISNRGAASAAVVWVVRDVEEARALCELALFANLGVEVVNDGNVKGRGTGLNPILAQLVAVTGVDRLERVAKVVNVTSDILKGPAFAALSNPAVHVVTERTEGNESVV